MDLDNELRPSEEDSRPINENLKAANRADGMHQVKESGASDNMHMSIPLDAVIEDHAGENTSA